MLGIFPFQTRDRPRLLARCAPQTDDTVCFPETSPQPLTGRFYRQTCTFHHSLDHVTKGPGKKDTAQDIGLELVVVMHATCIGSLLYL